MKRMIKLTVLRVIQYTHPKGGEDSEEVKAYSDWVFNAWRFYRKNAKAGYIREVRLFRNRFGRLMMLIEYESYEAFAKVKEQNESRRIDAQLNQHASNIYVSLWEPSLIHDPDRPGEYRILEPIRKE